MRKCLPYVIVGGFICLFLNCALRKMTPPDAFFELSGEDYPESHGVVIFDSTFVKWNLDGTGSERIHRCAKVFTTYGKNKYGEATFSYLDNYDTLVVKYAHTITPDGKLIPVAMENITDKPMPAWKGSQFLIPNLRMVKIVFPELEKGSGVEYEVEYIEHSPAFDSLFDSWYLFEGEEPIETKYLQICLPEEMQPRYEVVQGKLQHGELDARDRKIYTWEAKDVAPIIKEPAMPPLTDVVTKLVITTRPSWEQGSTWYYNMCEPVLVADSAVKSTVRDLIKDEIRFKNTLNALYEYVNKKVRYVETKILGKHGGFEPQPVSFTLRNKYGVCRDKAALLVGLLRAAGIDESYMVLTNPVMEFVDEIPALSQANHAIVAISTDTGWMYLDPTAEYSVEWLTPFESNKPVLVCTKDGEQLLYTPKQPSDANTMEVKATGKIGRNRELKQTMVMRGKGVMDMSLRQLFKYIPKEQFKQMILQSMRSTYGKATIDSICSGDPEDFSTPMNITIYITIPDFPTVIGDEWRIGGTGRANMSTISGNPWALEERKYPLELQFALKNCTEGELFFPEDMKVKLLPEPFEYDGKYMKVTGSQKVEGNRITSVGEVTLKEHRIPQEVYKELKEVMEQFRKYSEKEIILVKKN
ncbi:hypothetical protein CH333_09895 [candidate division WOR-3 bacterium JGI_Cruoil_03_44_89]|uniref:Transglutaminase-like domain-containing protein n=1 Tax=candidate division WOR-3 bacterium JGI_Cruoil_03_44_89 TaxID=1973748 RepID=A0A235BNG4_UNCW3|nr:MAG: hypothetical protein CH333_09895 [candidate division WOR-3 bacterium JGI_Cruoil_03_44_89]